ncbi:hypothetical protein ACOMHN_061867 [Nucella lapillus]
MCQRMTSHSEKISSIWRKRSIPRPHNIHGFHLHKQTHSTDLETHTATKFRKGCAPTAGELTALENFRHFLLSRLEHLQFTSVSAAS